MPDLEGQSPSGSMSKHMAFSESKNNINAKRFGSRSKMQSSNPSPSNSPSKKQLSPKMSKDHLRKNLSKSPSGKLVIVNENQNESRKDLQQELKNIHSTVVI